MLGEHTGRGFKPLSLLFTLALIFLLLPTSVLSVFGTEEDEAFSYNTYNIVLVTDCSGSMAYTDSREWRFNAIAKFVGLLPNEGNLLGSVVFDHRIVRADKPVPVADNAGKYAILDSIVKEKPQGDTNIGEALMTAIDMLNAASGNGNPSIILFLSDGKTDLPGDKKAEQVSLERKAEGIQLAREKGYKIHSICLNADGNADPDELRQMADATGGLFEVIENAEDLADVYNMFYKIIYNATIIQGKPEIFDTLGEINKSFEVANFGIKEANIIMSGSVQDYVLTDPSEREITKKDLGSKPFEYGDFQLVKLVRPEGGEWHLKAIGKPGDEVKIDFVYTGGMDVVLSAEPSGEKFTEGEKINLKAVLEEDGVPAVASQYEGYKTVLTITNAHGNAETIDMPRNGAAFSYEYIPQKDGTFTFEAEVKGFDQERKARPVEVYVNPPPEVIRPVLSAEDMSQRLLIAPPLSIFNVVNTKKIDLEKAVTYDMTNATEPLDNPYATLTYEIASTAYRQGSDYELSGSGLTMSEYSLKKGDYKIEVVDSYGQTAEFSLYVTTFNLGWLALIIPLAILGVIIFLAYRLLQKRFYGKIVVMPFDYEGGGIDGGMYEEEPGRGRLLLKAFAGPIRGFDDRAHFQATGQSYIYFISKTEFYVDGYEKVKKLRLDDGMNIRLSGYEDMQCGVTVVFNSAKSSWGYDSSTDW